MSKNKIMLSLLSVAVVCFTVWNVWDFCADSTHSTPAYLAMAFNFIAIVELVKLIYTEVKKNVRK